MAHGGKREGAGRKPGAQNKLTSVRAHDAARELVRPVECRLNALYKKLKRASNLVPPRVDLVYQRNYFWTAWADCGLLNPRTHRGRQEALRVAIVPKSQRRNRSRVHCLPVGCAI